MVSCEVKNSSSHKFSFEGLSGDTKPTGSWDTVVIENGSTYYEIDTGKVYMYDEENELWIEQ